MKNLLIFTVGAVAGAAGAYFYLNVKFEERLLSEIEQVKAVYAPQDAEPVEEKPEEEDVSKIRDKVSYSTEDMAKYQELVRTNYANTPDEEPPINEPATAPEPVFQVITKKEYDTRDQFDTAELTYYSRSDVLSTEIGEEVDFQEYLGDETIGYFGGTYPATIYVLNRNHGCKYMVTENNEVEVI